MWCRTRKAFWKEKKSVQGRQILSTWGRRPPSPSRNIIVTDKNINHPPKALRKHINKHNNPISPSFHRGTMSTVELRRSGSCVYWNWAVACLRIRCLCQDGVSQSGNVISSLFLCAFRNTMREEVQVQHPQRKSNQNKLVRFICMLPTLTEFILFFCIALDVGSSLPSSLYDKR